MKAIIFALGFLAGIWFCQINPTMANKLLTYVQDSHFMSGIIR